MKLEVVKQYGSDVVFILPWKGKHLAVKWEAPAGCIGSTFLFREELFDDDEAEEIHEFLRNNIDVSTVVTLREE